MRSQTLGALAALLLVLASHAPASAQEDEPPHVVVRRLLAEKDYARLEKLLGSAWSAGPATGTFTLLWDLVVPEPFPLADCDAWVKARPRSAIALACRGEAYVHAAWESRGSGWAYSVDAEGWRGFREQLTLAKADLEGALAIDPAVPEAARTLITVAMGLQLGRSAAEECLRRAVAACPFDYEAYSAMQYTRFPRWGGDLGDPLAFADDSIAARPDFPALRLLLVAAHLDHADYGLQADAGKPDPAAAKAYLSRADVRREIEEALAAVAKAYPRIGERLVEGRRGALAAASRDASWLTPQTSFGPPQPIARDDIAWQERLIRRRVREKQYADLERQLDALWELGRRPDNFETYWYRVMKRFTVEEMDAWCAARPRSAAAFAMRGNVRLEAAFAGSAVATSPARAPDLECLRLAKADLERAVELDPHCARAYRDLIRAAKALRLPRADVDGYLAKALAAAPLDLRPYWNMSEYLSPRWGGDLAEEFRFADATVAAHPEEPALMRLVVLAHRDAAWWGTRTDAARPDPEASRAYLAQTGVRDEIWWIFHRIGRRYSSWGAMCREDREALAAASDPSWKQWVSDDPDLPTPLVRPRGAGAGAALAPAAPPLASPSGPPPTSRPTPPGAPAPRPAASTASCATPEAWYAALLAAVRKGDYAAFERLHAPSLSDEVSRDDFAAVVGMLRDLGETGTFQEVKSGGVRVLTPGGRPLTKLKKVGEEWKAVEVVGGLR